MTDYTNISARAMLVGLHISTWSARKFDKAATRKVNKDHNANENASRVNKHLLAGAAAHENLMKRVERTRELHYGQTLPWADEGKRLLPTANYMQYNDLMYEEFAALDSLRDEFVAQYPQLVQDARREHQALGRLFNAADFPSVRRLKDKFSWTLEIWPVPSGGDIRVDLPAEQLEAITAQVRENAEAAARMAMTGAWERLYEAVARVRKATSPTVEGENGIVRSTLIAHVQDVVDVLKRLNVAESHELAALRERVERELTGIAVEDLRKDKALRKDTAARAEQIMKAMSAFYTPKPAAEDDDLFAASA